jgi:hypothetical protein
MPMQWRTTASEAVSPWRDQPPNARAHVDVEGLDWRSQRMANDDLPRRCGLTSHAPSMKALWLSINKSIHHDDVMLLIIIWPGGDVAACDPYSGDARILEHDAEEGQAPIARRGRDESAEQQLTVGAEVLHQRACRAVAALPAWPAPIRLVNVCEDRAEATDRCWRRTVGTWYEEQRLGNVAVDWSEQAQRTESAEDFAVGWIVEEPFKATLGPAHWGSRRKARPRCGELSAAGVQEHVERRYWVCGGVHTAAVPVDLAATAGERPWVVGVVGVPQRRAERIDGALLVPLDLPLPQVASSLRWLTLLMTLFYRNVPLSVLGRWCGVHKTDHPTLELGLALALWPTIYLWIVELVTAPMV